MIQDPQELNQVWELNKMAEPNFDPDKYLATKPSTEDFDPDAFLKLIESTIFSDGFQPVPTGTVVDQIPTGGYTAPAFVQTPNLSTGQKVYQNIVRPVLAPTLEMGGAVGVGLLGTPLGPAGIVGGSGLGYGLAKEGLENIDVALGLKPPRQGVDLLTQPLRNFVEGATYEAGGRVVAPYLAKGVNKLIDMGSSAQLKAAGIARSSLGDDIPQVLRTLKNAPPNASVAEITASIENPTWQALIQEALERDPQFLRKSQLFGEEESLKALSRLAGGGNAAEVRAVLENAKKALNVTTTPQREAALSRANLGKDVAEYEATAGKLSEAAAAKVADVRRLINAGQLAEASARLDLIKAGLPVGFSRHTYKGDLAVMADRWASDAANASLDLGQGARFSQAAADSLKSFGIQPLKTNSLVASIQGITQNPKFAGNRDLLSSVETVADDIARWTDKNGVIDANALEAIRKNSVNGVIQKLYPNADATTQKRLASNVLSSIRPLIDDAIEATGGTGWKKYLSNYREGMQKIAERELTGEALVLWKTNKDAFVRLVQNETPEAVEKVLGVGRYDIAKELSDGALDVLRQQANKRMTQLSVQSQITQGQKALSDLIKQNTSVMRFPSLLNVFATAGNKVLSEYEKAIGAKTMKILTDAMKTPEGAANLLETLPQAERSRVTELLLDPSLVRATIQETNRE
jgi:hypothetical protein